MDDAPGRPAVAGIFSKTITSREPGVWIWRKIILPVDFDRAENGMVKGEGASRVADG